MVKGVVAGSSELLNIGANRQFLKELALGLALRMEKKPPGSWKRNQGSPR